MTTTASETTVEKTDRPVRRKKNTEVQTVQHVETVPAPTTPDTLLRLAVENNFDLDKLTKLLELKDKYDKDQARKDYFYALSRFQAIVPEIKKTKRVYFNSSKGGTVEYWYAPLSEIVKQIQPAMEKAELTYRWETKQETTEIEIACIITHANGHQEKNVMRVPLDDSSGKNAIQQRGSSITYAQRYTLIGGLGLSSADSDVDAQGKKNAKANETRADHKQTPTEAQYKQMIQLVKDGKRTVKSFVDSCSLSDEQVLDLTSYVPQSN